MANLITFSISRWRERGDEAEARVRRAEGEKGDAVERMQRNVEALKQVSHLSALCLEARFKQCFSRDTSRRWNFNEQPMARKLQK